MNNKNVPKKLLPWLEAKKRHRLSDIQVQMARELGMNPKKFGSLDNHKQEPWKIPLPQFIEELYFKRFKRSKPTQVVSWLGSNSPAKGKTAGTTGHNPDKESGLAIYDLTAPEDM